MRDRRSVSDAVMADVLTASRRRCCLCFILRQDASEKRGQIAHLDQDRSNSQLDNLAFLCLEHHDQYDGRTSQSKGLTAQEVKRYRAQLVVALSQGTGSSPQPAPAPLSAAKPNDAAIATEIDSIAVYEQAVTATSDRFSVFSVKLQVLEPLNLPRFLESSILDLLKWASECSGVLETHGRIAHGSPPLSEKEMDSFAYYCFVALVRGFLLDRFAAKKDFAPDVLPPLPEREILQRRWYEDVLVDSKWLHKWSDTYSRDLVDAQWLAIERRGEDLTCPIPSAAYRVAMLQGMIARRFLMRGATSLSE